MRLTRHTDYALRVLIYLGSNGDRLCSVPEIARAHRISQNHLMKVVNQLVHAGFVSSVRGRAGGIRLAREPAETNVGAVLREMEGDFDLVDCQECAIARGCGLRGLLGEAAGAFLQVADRHTLADLLA